MAVIYDWPVGLIKAYGVMLPRLQARESMLEAERLGVGTGSLKAGPARETTQRWRGEAKLASGRRPKAAMPVDDLKAMGVAFKKVPATKRR